MTIPTSANVTGGIRNFGAFGNDVDGDCVCAATEHIRMCKGVTQQSRLKHVLYRLGFKPPTGVYTMDLYTQYLATLSEKPSPETGVDPAQWFAWLKAQGLVVDWGLILNYDLPTLQQAMIDYRGFLLAIELTDNAYNDVTPSKPWDVGPGEYDQPNPQLSHAVAVVEYSGLLQTCVTWGYLKAMTDSFVKTCWEGAVVFVTVEDKERLSAGAYEALLEATAALPKN
jgi:hypothetical protein